MGIYISPNCMAVDNLRVAWEASPTDCTPFVVGDLKICFEDLTNNRVDAIIKLLEEINITNLSCKFIPQQCSKQLQWAHWTRLKSYQRGQQHFPLTLAHGEETHLTGMFSSLVVECIKPKLCKQHRNDWISNKTWALVGQQTALRRVGKLSRGEGRWTKCLIRACFREDRAACTLSIGQLIVE